MPEANAKMIGRKIYQDHGGCLRPGRRRAGSGSRRSHHPRGGQGAPYEIADRLTQKALRIRGGQDIQYEKTQKGTFKGSIPMLAWVLRT